MDDQFFVKLREIQKKERANSSLARVGNDFYKRTHRYLDSIRDVARNDPFSEKSDLLKNVQRIATEICEIREHKIADAAVINIHRSYHLFQGKPQFDLVDTTPLNITEEEETLYFSFIDVLKNHRRGISLDQLTTHDEAIDTLNDDGVDCGSDSINKSSNTNNNDNNSNTKNNINNTNDINTNNSLNNASKNNEVENDAKNDQILNRLSEIKASKVIEDEPSESIEKQIAKSKYSVKNDNLKKIGKNKYNNTESLGNQQTNSFTEPKIESEKEKTSNLKNIKNTNKDNNSNVDSNINSDITSNIDDSKNTKNATDSVAKNLSSETKTLKQKSEFSNIIGSENEQFIDLDHLDHGIDHHDLDNNRLKRINSKSTVDRIANVMVLIFSEINSIMGVDKKVYGPFYPQDVVIMPDVNAAILIKNKKGRLVKV